MFWFKASALPQSRASRRRQLGHALASTSLVLSLITHSERVRAEPSDSDRATARSLAGEGYVALKQKDYQTAEDRFRRADELIHAPTLVVDHARALVGLRRYGEAYAAYQSVIDEQIPPNAPAVWKGAVKNAQRESDALRPHVAWLTLRVTKPLDAHIEIDGRALSSDALAVRMPTNPGERSVIVSAPGFITQAETRVLTEGGEVTIDFELAPEPKAEPRVVTRQAPPNSLQAEVDHRQAPNRTLAYVAFGVSGAGLATGAIAGILWLKLRSDITSSCGSLRCDVQSDSEASRREADKRRYDTLGMISGVGFAVGVAGAATGAALLVFAPKGPNKDVKTGHIQAYWGPTSVGVRGTF